jgi:hypothetical protein
MKKFKVVLSEGHSAKPDQVIDGCLASGYNDGKVGLYERKDAKKKASMFGGEIKEVEGLHNVLGILSMQTLPEDALLNDVVKELRGRESFIDADLTNDERLYSGDTFEAILCEQVEKKTLSKKALNQVEELSLIIRTDYLMVTIH